MASTSKTKTGQFNANCCVFGCYSKKMNDRSVHFHVFPPKNSGIRVRIQNEFGQEEEMDKREAWNKLLQMTKPVSKYMKVCSKHFKDSDYCARGVKMDRPKLERFAVPSQNLPIVYTLPSTKREKAKDEQKFEVISEVEYQSHLNKRKKTKNESNFEVISDIEYDMPLTKRKKAKDEQNFEVISEVEYEQSLNKRKNTKDEQNSEALSDVGLCESEIIRFEVVQDDLTDNENEDIQSIHSLSNDSSMFLDKAVQVTTGDIIVNFASIIQQEKNLNFLTGLESFQMLESLTKLITDMCPDKKTHKLSVKDRIIMVLMKLKMSLKFNILSLLFSISPSLCKRTFIVYIGYLAKIFKPCIYWPSYEECQQNMPLCFNNFKNVRVVLDRLDITIEKPKCLCCRVGTYSQQKGKQTIKIMTGFSPAGIITFISKAYGGRTSDKNIFLQSNLMKQLQPKRDAIMVNENFLIGQICFENCIKAITPHYSNHKTNFTDSESQENVLISKAFQRVHIERVKQRIRTFSILNNPLPNTLIPLIDNIMVTICGIVNLQKSVLVNDKF